jgi:hypothetical protein
MEITIPAPVPAAGLPEPFTFDAGQASLESVKTPLSDPGFLPIGLIGGHRWRLRRGIGNK